MTFSEYTRENTPISARPECPMCAAQMYLARIEPEKPGHDLRTFECLRADWSDHRLAGCAWTKLPARI